MPLSPTTASPRSPAIPGARTSRRGGAFRRTGVVAAVITILLLIGVYALLRMTPLSAVEDVTIVGVEGPRASAIRASLDDAARGQSTLGFRTEALRDAVADRTSIIGVEAHPRFPHGVQIDVRQRVAVAALAVGDRRVAVASDGTLLKDWAAGRLPILNGGRAEGGRLVSTQRDAVRILSVAPEALLRRVARVDRTTIVRLASGPALLFHDTTRINAKWAAAVAVLGDPQAVGATWIDLRVPERPVAGSGAPMALAAPGVPARQRGNSASGPAPSDASRAASAPTSGVNPTNSTGISGAESAAGGPTGTASPDAASTAEPPGAAEAQP